MTTLINLITAFATALFGFFASESETLRQFFRSTFLNLFTFFTDSLIFALSSIGDWMFKLVELCYEVVFQPAIELAVDAVSPIISDLTAEFPSVFATASAINGYVNVALISSSIALVFTAVTITAVLKFVIKLVPTVG